MEILVFRYKNDILLMLDKSTLDEEKHPQQIAPMLQRELIKKNLKDWNDIDFNEGGQLYAQHPSYEWYGNQGKIVVVGETFKIRDMMKEMFSIV